MDHINLDDRKFLACLTLALVGASLWLFKHYIIYLLVSALLALATSHLFSAIKKVFSRGKDNGFVYRHREIISSLILTFLFLFMIFTPLLYFVSITYEQATNLDIGQIKSTLSEMVDNTIMYLGKISFLREALARIKEEGLSLITGPALDALFDAARALVGGAALLWVK